MKFDYQPVFDPDYTVTKDGKPLDLVHSADEEKGTATILCTDREGNPIKNDSELGYETIEVKGKIQITKSAKPEKTNPSTGDPGEAYDYADNPFPYGCCGALQAQRYTPILVSEKFSLKSKRVRYKVDDGDRAITERQAFTLEVDGLKQEFPFYLYPVQIVFTPRLLHIFLTPAENAPDGVCLSIPPARILMDYHFPSAKLAEGRYSTPPVNLYGTVVQDQETWDRNAVEHGACLLSQWLLGEGRDAS